MYLIDGVLCCEICGDSRKLHTKTKKNKFNMILCVKHYAHLHRYGRILERTLQDKNEIIYEDTFAKIVLYDKEGNINGYSLIDLEDVEKIKDYKWYLTRDGYCANSVKSKNRVRLHRFLLNVQDDKIVDHVNRDKLDNRKCNLRIATPSENMHNRNLSKNNKSGFSGIWHDVKRGKWEVQICINNRKKRIGIFVKLEDAIEARLRAELEYFGDQFAPQRHLFEEYSIN